MRPQVLFELKNVTPIFTARGMLDRRRKVIDVSGLSIRGLVRKFYRIFYYPFYYPTLRDLLETEKEIFGSSGDHGHASKVAFDFRKGRSARLDRRKIAKRYNDGWASDLAFTEGSEFLLYIWEHLPRMGVEDPEWDIVLKSIEAWILFGGYGRRSRKGLGSLIFINSEGYESMLSGIDWDDLRSIADGIRNFLKALYGGNFKVRIGSVNPWGYFHPVLCKYSVIAVGSTKCKAYYKALSFIQRRIIGGMPLRRFAGRGGENRDPSQIFISLKRYNREGNYNFVLLFAPRGGTSTSFLSDAKSALLRRLKSIEEKGECQIIFP